MSKITRVGVDLAKNLIQVHAVDVSGRVLYARALKRDKFLPWCEQLPAGCLVAMEACSSSHHWARKLCALGLDARIIAAQLVSPYRLQGTGAKNDANDAAAICEAASRPCMRFVSIKSTQQQAVLCVHRLRQGYQRDRTACINRIRGLLAEFGVVMSQSPKVLWQGLLDVLEDASNELPGLARMALQQSQEHWRQIDEYIAWCDARINEHVKHDAQAQSAATLQGIGALGASALAATVGEFKQFKNGAQFGAWLGLTPRQNSSGGKTHLGHITKRGDIYLRTLLIQGAKSAVFTAQRRDDPISRWTLALREKVGWQRAAVALANKNARILWAVLTKNQPFDVNHISSKPQTAVA